MEHFTDEARNGEFREWMKENPGGFYLNHRGRAFDDAPPRGMLPSRRRGEIGPLEESEGRVRGQRGTRGVASWGGAVYGAVFDVPSVTRGGGAEEEKCVG